MRTALYQYLTQHATTIASWHSPFLATAETSKPYGVIKLGPVMRSLNGRGSFRELEIWLYFGGSSWLEVDHAVKEIRRLLHGKQLQTAGGQRFELEWVHEHQDFYDDDLNALTRRIDFRIPLVGLL